MKKKTTVSLVLGSGGARGLAHIGIIRWLEENNFEIKSISGCSMGALVGGIYATGKLAIFEQWITEISKLDIFFLLDITWKSGGFVQGDKIINTLIELFGDQDIETLPIKFTAVAADIENGKEVWMDEGSLFEAIRASISLPLFFTPVTRNGAKLIDGGVLNPVPIAPTFRDDTDITIAVNLDSAVDVRLNNKIPQDKELVNNETKIEENPNLELDFGPEKEPLRMQIQNIKDSLQAFQKPIYQAVETAVESTLANEKISLMSLRISDYMLRFKSKSPLPKSREWSAYEVINLAFDTMQSAIARQKLAAYPPDYTIEIARNTCKILEFERGQEMISLGYDKAEEFLAGHFDCKQKSEAPE
ncbi:MAG TPA: serine protease [Psychromonas hadalis]|nr:serine protease [Psychromonas hadalis]